MRALGTIRIGMPVVDANGDDVGTVADLKDGDPTAASAEGQRVGERSSLVQFVKEAIAGAEPNVPDEMAERLLRVGYIKVDASGVLTGSCYVAADDIAGVSDDVVHLKVVPDR